MVPNILQIFLVCCAILPNHTNLHSGVRRFIQSPVTKPSSLEQQVIAKEREGLDCLKTGDLKRFAGLIADDAILVDAGGRSGKVEVVKDVVNLKIVNYTIRDTKFSPLSATSGLLVYTLHETGSYAGSDFTKEAYASVIWTKRGDRWQCIFSQETEIK